MSENQEKDTSVRDKTIKAIEDRKNDLKKSILQFYGEVLRLKKGEDRKYDFPITVTTCMETINLCYEYITTLEELYSYVPENAGDYDVEVQTTNISLLQIEEYSHVLEAEHPTEILDENNAVQVTSPKPQETKGKEKRKRTTVKEAAGTEENLTKPVENDKIKEEKKVEVTIDSVVNEKEVTKDELYQIKDIPEQLIKETEPEKIITGNDVSDVTEEKKEEPLIVKENIDNLTIEQPEEDDEINLKVVVDSDNKKEEVVNKSVYQSDNTPMLTDEDIIADRQDENIEDIELIINDDKAGDESESIETLPEDLIETSVKSISRNKTYGFKAKLQKKNIDEKTVSNIKLFAYNENDENLRKEYLDSHNNMISAPHVSRVMLLMSGYFIEISSYGNWDTISLERIMRNKSTDFVDKEIAILNSIYNHIVYFSYTQTKPAFEDWLSTVKFPDYEILFYGLFDANYDGINYFRLTCPYCGNDDIVVGKENKDLVVALDKSYTKESLIEQITTREMNKLDTNSVLPKWANTTRIRVMTQNTKILFEYGVPTLFDYLQMLTTARRISLRDNKPLDLSKILDPESDEYSRLLLYLYIKTVGIPSPVYGNPEKPKEATSYKYIGLTNKADIIEAINAIDIDDYSMLLTSDPVRELLTKRSVYYFVKDTKCTNENCNKIIKYVNLDPRTIFFSRITEATKTLML
jgi:hypothetical protein